MKIVKIKTPKNNNLALLGKRSVSPPMLKNLSIERGLKKLSKRMSEKENKDMRWIESKHQTPQDVSRQIDQLEAQWSEIKSKRELTNSTRMTSPKKFFAQPFKTEIHYARVNLERSISTTEWTDKSQNLRVLSQSTNLSQSDKKYYSSIDNDRTSDKQSSEENLIFSKLWPVKATKRMPIIKLGKIYSVGAENKAKPGIHLVSPSHRTSLRH